MTLCILFFSESPAVRFALNDVCHIKNTYFRLSNFNHYWSFLICLANIIKYIWSWVLPFSWRGESKNIKVSSKISPRTLHLALTHSFLMSSWNFPNMLNTILSWPRLFMCVNLQSGPQRIIGFGQTAPNLLKDTASILDSPLLLWKISSSLPRCGSSSSRIGGSRAADYLGCWSPESLLPAFQQLLPARESRRATRQRPSPLPCLPFRQSHQRNFSSSSSAAGPKKPF